MRIEFKTSNMNSLAHVIAELYFVPIGVCVGGWVGWGGGASKNLKSSELEF